MNFFLEMRRACGDVLENSPHLYTATVSIDGHLLSVCSHCQLLLSLFTSVLPLGILDPGVKPEFKINIWSPEAFDVQKPAMPSGMAQMISNRAANISSSSEVLADYDPTAQILTLIYTKMGLVDVCVGNMASLHAGILTDPLRPVLDWLLRSHNKFLLHASAVSVNNKAALFVGPSGAGKSTTALKCSESGMKFLGDDTCGLDLSSPPSVFNVYGCAKAVPADRDQYYSYSPLGSPEGLSAKPRKWLIDLVNTGFVEIGEKSELRVIILLVDKGLSWHSNKAATSRVVKTIVSTSNSFLPAGGIPLLSAINQLASSVPLVEVCLGFDTLKSIEKIRQGIVSPESLL